MTNKINPDFVSKVVDKNSEPLVVWHGTANQFTEFKPSKMGNFGPGIYFTPDKEQAEAINEKYGVNWTETDLFDALDEASRGRERLLVPKNIAYSRRAQRRSLKEQLSRGNDFSEINFGKLNPRQAALINQIRTDTGQPLLRNGELILPKHVVQHLYERRVLNDGMSADEVADMVHSVLTSKKSRVAKGNQADSQKLIRVKESLSRIGIIGTSRKGQDVLITSYPIATRRIKNALEGRARPSSDTDVTIGPADARLSGVQGNINLSRTAQNTSSKLTHTQAEAALKPLRSKLGKDAPKITVVQAPTDFSIPTIRSRRKNPRSCPKLKASTSPDATKKPREDD